MAEITLTDTERLGLDYEIRPGNTTFLGRTLPSRGSVLTGILSALGTPTDGITPGLLGVTGIFGPGNVRILVNALATDSRVKILSAPSVLASDNRPARIQVGSQQPTATGSVATPISTSTPGGTGFARVRRSSIKTPVECHYHSAGQFPGAGESADIGRGEPNKGNVQ